MLDPSADKSIIGIVDDDRSVRRGLSNLLKSEGYLTECFPSGEDLLASDRHARFDFLILDVKLSGVDGFEVGRRLAESGVDVPVIFVSALGDEITRKRALGAGAVSFFPKPIDVDALLGAIQGALATRAGADEGK